MELKIKKRCGCDMGGETLTPAVKNDFTFYVLQQANKYGYNRAIVVKDGQVYDIAEKAVTEETILAIVPVGLTSIKQVKQW
jgi:hypothetical protein